jgi:hypothetical protein
MTCQIVLARKNSTKIEEKWGSACFVTSIDQSTSPVLKPGLLNIPCIHQVFDMGAESEVKEMENDEGNNEPDEGDGYCIYFQPDIESELKDNKAHGIWLEDPRLVQGEKSFQLNIEQELEELGLRLLMDEERNNLKAITMKIGNQLTQKAYKGVQKLTQGCMAIASEYISG